MTTTWEAIAIIASSAVAVLAFLDDWMRRKRQRSNTTADAVRSLETRMIKLEDSQFGDNHGGLRQKVNELDVKVDGIAEAVAEIRGELKTR